MVLRFFLFNVDPVLFDKMTVDYAKENPKHYLFEHYANREYINGTLIGRINEEHIHAEVAHKNIKNCYHTCMNSVEIFTYSRKHNESDISQCCSYKEENEQKFQDVFDSSLDNTHRHV